MRAVPRPSLRIALAAAAALAFASTGLASAVPPPAFSAPVPLGFQHGDDWEPSIAADTSGHVYALWTHYVDFSGGGAGDPDPTCPTCASPHMVIQISTDYGATFGQPHALAPSALRQDDPQIVVDAADGRTVYAAFMQGNKASLYVAKSTDYGAHFNPVLVEPLERGLDKIALAARGGHVYLSYHSVEKTFVSTSLDAGATWTVSQPIHNTNSKFGVSFPSGAAVAPDGTAYFAWNGVNKPGQAKGGGTLYVTKTADAGQTWTTSIVDTSEAPKSCNCEGYGYWSPQMALGVDDNGYVYVLYGATDVVGGPERQWFRSSTDGAATWSGRHDISGSSVGSNNLFPALVSADDGDVRIAWTDDRNGHDAGGHDPNARWNTYYRSSTDGGATWSGEAKLSASTGAYGYENATPKDGYLQPYGDYFEIDIDGHGDTVALWGEGYSWVGPGNVWFAHQ